MIEIYIDGATKKNGHADAISGIGVYIPSTELYLFRRVNEIKNNRAELNALLLALEYCEEMNYYNDKIIIYTDSKLIVNQYNGEFYINSNRDLWDIVREYPFVELKWIGRDNNKVADLLSNKGCKSEINYNPKRI